MRSGQRRLRWELYNHVLFDDLIPRGINTFFLDLFFCRIYIDHIPIINLLCTMVLNNVATRIF